MKKIFVLVLLFIALLPAQDKVKVTYIANEGFLIENNGTKILIDALFSDQTINYAHVPDKNMLENIYEGKGIYKNINYVFATHYHRDHFNAATVSGFLSKNREVKFISTKQSYESLSELDGFREIKDQVISVLPAEKEIKSFQLDKIKVKVYRFNHSKYMEVDPETGKQRNRHADIENLGFLIEVNGNKIFHNGDASFLDQREYKAYNLQNENIDLAFLPAGFGTKSGQEIFNKYIKAKKVVLMHLNPESIKQFIEVFKKSTIINVFSDQEKSLEFSFSK